MTPAATESPSARSASIIALLAGMWLFASPWVYGAYASPNAWNSWIVGALVFLFAAIRITSPRSTGVSWLNVILGIWTFISPWIYGYTAHGDRFANSLIVGAVVFIAAIVSANAMGHGPRVPTQRTT